ncbi:hypothetical protein CRE_16388 [Caenorhabditis remanei]|uniref:6-phosphogluconolactonase n=2 Tax=Caenorhabditis remanei TaxID=31234 RepID=E3NC55_CAERE|nr:hypothetical protein CRE_16388 [Caenorhabditis remanei]
MCLSNGYEGDVIDNMKTEVKVSADEEELVAQLRNYLTEKLTYLLEQNGTISIGVSGGSMPKVWSEALLSVAPELLNWKRIRIFMVDERHVPRDHEDSNLGAYLQLFPQELHHVFIPVPISKQVVHTAQAYEINLRKYLLPEQLNTYPRFDILFLGAGPDGHTASIFPGKEQLEKITDLNWVSVITDSPKPPPSRVTITMQCIQNAKNVAFILTGANKRDVVRAIHEGDKSIPAAQARPMNNKMILFLDEHAAAGVPNRESSESESPPPFDT